MIKLYNTEDYRKKLLKSITNKLDRSGIKKTKKVIEIILNSINFNNPNKISTNKMDIRYEANKDLLFVFNLSLNALKFDLYNLLCGKVVKHNGVKKLTKSRELEKIQPLLEKICNVLTIDIIEHHGYHLLMNNTVTPITINVDSALMMYWVSIQVPATLAENYHSHSEFNGFVINNFYSKNDKHSRIYNFLSFKSSDSRINFLKKLNQGNNIYEIDLVSSVPQAIAKLSNATSINEKIKNQELIIEDSETFDMIISKHPQLVANQNLIVQLNKCINSRGKLKLLLNSSIFALIVGKQRKLNASIINHIFKSRDISNVDIDKFISYVENLNDIDIVFKIEDPLRTQAMYKQGINLHDAIYVPTFERVIEVESNLKLMDLYYKVTKH